jgi:hypothetical protein
MSSLNAKGLCPIGAKERHERSAESKGMTIKHLGKKTAIKQRTDRNKELVKLELLMFKKIWETRPHFCEWCKTPITVFSPINYHHIKTKGAHPELRLEETNIVKICAECHIKEHGFKPKSSIKV